MNFAAGGVVLLFALALGCYDSSGSDTSEAFDDGQDDDGGADGDADADADADRDADADACVPDCEGRACGDDGCGGACPPGCDEDEICATPPGECVASRDWVEIPATSPAQGAASMAYDSGRGILVLFADREGSAGTWEGDGTSWTEVMTPTTLGSRGLEAMAYDSGRGVVALFGGAFCVYYFTELRCIGLDDTWDYGGTSWTQVPTPPAPPGRYWHAMAYDSGRGVVVLFGGEDSDLESGATWQLADTWEYDGMTWTEVVTPTSPPARRGHAMAYDAGRGVVVLFGGVWYDELLRSTYLADTWEYDGTTWNEVATPTSPSARNNHAMAYDSARGVVVLFGGEGPGAPPTYDFRGDTWEYDGTMWTEVRTPTSPSVRNQHGMAYDSTHDAVVLFGGMHWEIPAGLMPMGDTWEYNGL